MNWKYLLDSIIVFSIRHHLDRGGEALLCSMPRDAAHVALLARKWMPKNQSPVISQSSKLLIIKISPKTWSSSRSSKRQKSVARLSLMNGHHATQRSVSFSPNQTSWNQVFVDFLCLFEFFVRCRWGFRLVSWGNVFGTWRFLHRNLNDTKWQDDDEKDEEPLSLRAQRIPEGARQTSKAAASLGPTTPVVATTRTNPEETSSIEKQESRDRNGRNRGQNSPWNSPLDSS